MQARSTFPIYTEAGLDAVLHRHADLVVGIEDLKRVSG